MNIYITLEIKKRELQSKLLLSLEAANRGHEVYLGRMMENLKKGEFYPGLVHLKSITPSKNRINQMLDLKKKGFKITSLDEEHGYIDENDNYVNQRYSSNTLDIVDKIFTCGVFDFKNIKKKFPKYFSKIINSGNPRFDFWRNDFKKFYKNIDYIKYNNFILVSSNFEYVCTYKTLSDDLKFLKKAGYFKRGETKDNIIFRAKQSKKLFKQFVKLIKKINFKFKNIKIIIRPHPTDNPKKWKNYFLNNNNIEVIEHGFLSDWISKSKCIIHAGCTSGLEAAARNITCFSYNPNNLKNGSKISDNLSIKIKNENQAIKLLEEVFNKNKRLKLKNNKKIVTSRVRNITKNFAYKEIIKSWEKFNSSELSKKNNLFFIKFKFIFKKIMKDIFKLNYHNHKFENFKRSEIYEFLSRINRIKPEFKKIKFEIIKPDLIRLYK